MNKEKVLALPFVRSAGFGPGSEASPLVEQGSDRLFYRLSTDGRCAVLMVSPAGDLDFGRYVEIGRYLHGLGLGVPEIYETDSASSSLLMEDLGDETLYRVSGRRGGAESLIKEYRAVLDLLAKLQSETKGSFSSCPSVSERSLDYKVLRWETAYFADNFLAGELGLGAEEIGSLDKEFHLLAEAVAEHPRSFLHRDFQSQNILLKDGKVRIVDFQGARGGSSAYDLASLLKDSYIAIPGSLRREFLSYFVKRTGSPGIEASFLAAGLQRNMQALGAFSFLSRVKGRRQFRKFIPLGLRHLREGLAALEKSGSPPGPLPKLAALCARAPDAAHFLKSSPDGFLSGGPEGPRNTQV